MKKQLEEEKTAGLHPHNIHKGMYDFNKLVKACPQLEAFVVRNRYGNQTLDFSNPLAVKFLNMALLKAYHQIDFWDIPNGYLCPPIPGRADYLYYAADLLAESNDQTIPLEDQVDVLDIGTGASMIYPILGISIFGWNFVGSDIDKVSLASGKEIIDRNDHLKKIQLRLQNDPSRIFKDVVKAGEFFDLIMCNPPFHASEQEALAGTGRKIKNLTGKRQPRPLLNFGGMSNELWCEGGEIDFIGRMIQESAQIGFSCLWFTSLVSKESSLKVIYSQLASIGAVEVKTVSMSQGNKKSRFVAWTFLSASQKEKWKLGRWGNKKGHH